MVLPFQKISLAKQLSLATVTGMALLYLCTPVWSADGRLQGIQYDASTRHFQINSAGEVKATVNTLNIAGHKRIIIDLDNAEIGSELPRDVQLLHDLSRQLPALSNLTVNQYAGNGRPIVRILMDIHGDPGTIRLVRNQGSRIELEFNESANATRNSYAQPPSLSRLNNSDYQPTYTTTPTPPVYSSQAQPESQLSDVDLRRTLVILNQKYENLAQENQYLKAKLTNAEQGQSANQSAQQRDREEQNRLKAEIDRLKVSNSNLQTQVNGLLTEKRQPDPALADKQAEISRLQSENQSLNSRLAKALAAPKEDSGMASMKNTLAEMNRRYDLLVQENQNLKNKISSQSTIANNVSAQKSEIARLTQDKQTLSSENTRLRIELETKSTQASASQKSELARLTQEKQTLASENSRLKAELTEKANQSASALSEADLQALRRQLTVAQSSLNESIRTINEQNKEIAYLKNQVSDVKSGLDSSSKEQIAAMQTRLDDKDITIRDLQRQLNSKATTASSSNNVEVSNLKKQNQQYQTDLASLQEKVRTLNTQLTDANNKAAKAQAGKISTDEVKKRDTQISGLQQENNRLKTAIQSGDAAKKELAGIKADMEKLKQASASIKGNPADKEAIAKLTREKQALRDELDTIKMTQQQGSADTEKVSQLENNVASLEAQITSLKSQYEQATKEAAQAKQALASAQTKPSGKATPPAKADTTQIASLNQQLSDLRKENANLKTSLSAQSVNRSTSTNSEAEKAYNLGKAELSAKKVDVALGKFKEALLLDADNSKYAVDYSVALAEDHQYAEAIDVLRRYLQRNPGDREAYNQLGKIYLLNDQADAANQAFTRAIPISVLNNYATSLKKLGNTEDAESVFKLALSVNPKDSEVLFNLGNLYNAENKLEQARNKYLEALQLRPDFAEAHYNVGLVFSKLGDNVKAVSHLEKFLQLSPNARNAETIRAYVQKLKA
jgi:tetratricopeptide (TPR) repeat protein